MKQFTLYFSSIEYSFARVCKDSDEFKEICDKLEVDECILLNFSGSIFVKRAI